MRGNGTCGGAASGPLPCAGHAARRAPSAGHRRGIERQGSPFPTAFAGGRLYSGRCSTFGGCAVRGMGRASSVIGGGVRGHVGDCVDHLGGGGGRAGAGGTEASGKVELGVGPQRDAHSERRSRVGCVVRPRRTVPRPPPPAASERPPSAARAPPPRSGPQRPWTQCRPRRHMPPPLPPAGPEPHEAPHASPDRAPEVGGGGRSDPGPPHILRP